MFRRIQRGHAAKPVVRLRADQVAADLSAEEPRLDDVTLARMERALLGAWRARASRLESFPSRRARPRRALSAAVLASGVAAAAAVGAVFGLYMLEQGSVPRAANSGAQFEMQLGEGALQRGTLAEGQTLESGRYGHVQVDIGHTRVEMEPDARVRFDRISPQRVELTLLEGAIDAHFNPEHESKRTMAVETRAARVVVVGTRFSVAVDGQGNTKVAVREGIVDVVPRNGRTERIAAGQRVEVLLDAGDDTERAVREALAAQLQAVDELDIAEEDQATSQPDLVGPSVAATVVEDPLAEEQGLEQARRLLRNGRHKVARLRLRRLANDSNATSNSRAEALTLIAESFTAQGKVPEAADAYRAAADMAAAAPVGHNAVFALARLLERYTHDLEGAIAAYERYLRRAPAGALAGQAGRALCRLGDSARCVTSSIDVELP